MRHNTPPSVEVEGADDDPTSRASNEIVVIDPLDPSLAPILVRTSEDFESSADDDDLISDILPPAEESIEDDTSSDIPENQDDPQSDQDDIPPPVPAASFLTHQEKDLAMITLLDSSGLQCYLA